MYLYLQLKFEKAVVATAVVVHIGIDGGLLNSRSIIVSHILEDNESESIGELEVISEHSIMIGWVIIG